MTKLFVQDSYYNQPLAILGCDVIQMHSENGAYPFQSWYQLPSAPKISLFDGYVKWLVSWWMKALGSPYRFLVDLQCSKEDNSVPTQNKTKTVSVRH